jgi:hypothetical protein
VVAAQVTAPPALFVVNVPHGWIKPTQAAISWVPAASANGPLRYQVVLDGRVRATPAGAFEAHLDPRGLGDGVHRVQVLATDADGQATLMPPSALRVAGSPPTVKVRLTRGGSAIVVRIRDAGPGVDRAGVSIRFGDGGRAAKKTVFRHRYARAGIYRLVVRVRDKLGNAGVVRRLVSVR